MNLRRAAEAVSESEGECAGVGRTRRALRERGCDGIDGSSAHSWESCIGGLSLDTELRLTKCCGRRASRRGQNTEMDQLFGQLVRVSTADPQHQD